jgi:hypothetical protein
MASVVPSIRVIKQSHYKGGLRNWSNRYHFTGGTPADNTHWTTLSDAIVTAEKAVLYSSTTIIETIGYAAGSDVPVFSKVYSTAGTQTAAAATFVPPLECCALVRWSTAASSTKNHPIYAFSYFHGKGFFDSNTWKETLEANAVTALGTYAASWQTGFSDGSITAKRATQGGHTVTGHIVEEYLTHRDFPFQSSV